MKVLLFNGSPHEKGCTYTALNIIAHELNLEEIDTEIFFVGNKPLASCNGCAVCKKTGKCVIDDEVNVFLEKAKQADGFVFGSPVHYASASGISSTFLDRVFYAGGATSIFRHKPASTIASARRAGTTATLDQLNKYLLFSEMPIITSRYWNMVHGSNPEDVMKDEEGVQIMRVLGKNMAWFLKSLEVAKNAGVLPPEKEIPIKTNYIR